MSEHASRLEDDCNFEGRDLTDELDKVADDVDINTDQEHSPRQDDLHQHDEQYNIEVEHTSDADGDDAQEVDASPSQQQ